MDTDWCIMCDSHCNISGAIYCSEECKLRDHMENAYYPPSTSINWWWSRRFTIRNQSEAFFKSSIASSTTAYAVLPPGPNASL
ncbi:8506_t:CDS:2 [Acaulospora morrowiae]|uniref:8506_t:CDS:1 n=1 Tax=Acaulospora morrowiae TaxID=94023 RepID=A0A9N9G9F4_9GLOM|nr:8506_t:CDS:2 [Acaulospora morrowiae]